MIWKVWKQKMKGRDACNTVAGDDFYLRILGLSFSGK